MAERRTGTGPSRKHRIAVGSVSAPLSIVAVFVFHKLWGQDMPVEIAIAVASVTSTILTTMSICFWDLRGIVLNRIKTRRVGDRQ